MAENKTKLLKYVSDTCKASFARSLAFEDTVISGLGWLDHGVGSDESLEQIYIRYVDWRNVWYDSHAKERDMSDGRYMFLSKVVDYDIAVAMFPERADCIRAALNANDNAVDEYAEYNINPDEDNLGDMGDALETDVQRDRVRLISCEYKIPSAVKILRGEGLGTLNGAIYDKKNKGMSYLVKHGHASLHNAVRLVVWKMIFCGNYVLQNRKRIYNHHRFSLVPIWGYRKKLYNDPFGIVETQIDAQDDYNKRSSKALFILSTKQSVVQKNAVDDMDAFVAERNRPDGNMVVNDMAGIDIREERGLAQEHVMLMDRDRQFIESASGVTDEARGIETNATSGIGMRSREQQAHVTSAELFDNYRYAFQISGEITLSLVEQFFTQEKAIRLVGDKGQTDFLDINAVDESGEIKNDITSTQADFIVEAESYHATIRQAMFESFGELITRFPPDVSIKLLDIWIELSDYPGKDAFIARIRSVTGQPNPDEDQNDPAVIARIEAEQADSQRQKAIQDKLMDLEVMLKEAEVDLKKAKAEKDLAHAENQLADISNDIELLRIKKAEALNKIESTEKGSGTEGDSERTDMERKESLRPITPSGGFTG